MKKAAGMAAMFALVAGVSFGQTETFSQNLVLSYPLRDTNGYACSTVMRASTNVYFTNTMTTAQMQASIDGIPKDLGGYALNFYVQGKITNTASLTFSGFRNGTLNISGSAVTGPSSSQTSIVTNSANTYVFYFVSIDSSCPVTVDSVRAETKAGAGSSPFWFDACPGYNTVKNCMCWGGGTGSGVVARKFSCVYVTQTGFAASGAGMYCGSGANVVAFNNANVGGAQPSSGHYVDTGGTIQRVDAGAVGATDNLVAGQGGLIVTSAGKQLP